jgi:hypothetical protein
MIAIAGLAPAQMQAATAPRGLPFTSIGAE